MTTYNDLLSLSGQNSGLIHDLFELYQRDPALVGTTWARFFEKLSASGGVGTPQPLGLEEPRSAAAVSTNATLLLRAFKLLSAFRNHGHLLATTNPLTSNRVDLPLPEDLHLEKYGFTAQELDTVVPADGVSGKAALPLRDLIAALTSSYTGSLGVEYGHLVRDEQRLWLQSRLENSTFSLTVDEKKNAYRKLVAAEQFESLLHKKYVGQKRFSLQGGESLIPLLDRIIHTGGSLGVKEIVFGKAHRGRLNVLCNIVGKPLEKLFTEFEDTTTYSVLGAGDVKYHKGYSSEYVTSGGVKVQVSLAPNPSHLEFVNPIVEGIARARQDLFHHRDRTSVMPVLMHGDAAFIGQGIVYETLNLANVDGYRTGGTIHIIVNNQLGFTTNPKDSRSTLSCTDIAKGFYAPIFHVNAEDVDAVLRCADLATEFRQKFGQDVIIDLLCYRKYGHNEGDDPTFTQPKLYAEINQKLSIPTLYGKQLASSSVLTEQEILGEVEQYTKLFSYAYENRDQHPTGEACSTYGKIRIPTPPTGVPLNALTKIADALVNYPESFTPHPKLKQILDKRVQTLKDGKGIDWGFAEALAYGSLMMEGHSVRLSGQDCGRGTFSHRHLALNDVTKFDDRYYPLSRLNEGEGKAEGRFEVFNSTLSEAAVLGFEFGYSSIATESLVMWEAQFGDFANGAQVIIDQFIASSESKWEQYSGVTMLLPHGYEGQGPEHSSARLERYLQLCAQGNMTVCAPTNAGQIFHLLRKQAKSELKRPLIVMTPKSLLRLPEACVEAQTLTDGEFLPLIADSFMEKGKPRNFVMTSGKIYYELANALREQKGISVVLVRFEQLHPFPQYEFSQFVKQYGSKKFFWVQEEPQNQGAWSYIEPLLRAKVGEIAYVGREASASPAAGSTKRHTAEQTAIIKELVKLLKEKE